ncbi:MAG: alpha/beta hydrolase, partial [Bacteroidota bacterium]
MTKLTFLLLLLLACSNQVIAQTSLEAIGLEYGPHKAGFTYQVKIDSTRTYQIKNEFNNQYIFRPIPISLWYPAVDNSDESPLTILNYLEILKAEEEWQNLPNEFLLD